MQAPGYTVWRAIPGGSADPNFDLHVVAVSDDEHWLFVNDGKGVFKLIQNVHPRRYYESKDVVNIPAEEERPADTRSPEPQEPLTKKKKADSGASSSQSVLMTKGSSQPSATVVPVKKEPGVQQQQSEDDEDSYEASLKLTKSSKQTEARILHLTKIYPTVEQRGDDAIRQEWIKSVFVTHKMDVQPTFDKVLAFVKKDKRAMADFREWRETWLKARVLQPNDPQTTQALEAEYNKLVANLAVPTTAIPQLPKLKARKLEQPKKYRQQIKDDEKAVQATATEKKFADALKKYKAARDTLQRANREAYMFRILRHYFNGGSTDDSIIQESDDLDDTVQAAVGKISIPRFDEALAMKEVMDSIDGNLVATFKAALIMAGIPTHHNHVLTEVESKRPQTEVAAQYLIPGQRVGTLAMAYAAAMIDLTSNKDEYARLRGRWLQLLNEHRANRQKIMRQAPVVIDDDDDDDGGGGRKQLSPPQRSAALAPATKRAKHVAYVYITEADLVDNADDSQTQLIQKEARVQQEVSRLDKIPNRTREENKSLLAVNQRLHQIQLHLEQLRNQGVVIDLTRGGGGESAVKRSKQSGGGVYSRDVVVHEEKSAAEPDSEPSKAADAPPPPQQSKYILMKTLCKKQSRKCCKERARFHEMRELGQGVNGTVYLCKHKESQQIYAMKIMAEPEHWRREVKALIKLNKAKFHAAPTLVDYWYCTDRAGYKYHRDEKYFIVMTYIPDAITLDDLFDDQGRKFSKNQLIALLELKDNIEKMHALGIYHNDLHAKNIVWNGTMFMIIDFGLARETDNRPVKAEPWSFSLDEYGVPTDYENPYVYEQYEKDLEWRLANPDAPEAADPVLAVESEDELADQEEEEDDDGRGFSDEDGGDDEEEIIEGDDEDAWLPYGTLVETFHGMQVLHFDMATLKRVQRTELTQSILESISTKAGCGDVYMEYIVRKLLSPKLENVFAAFIDTSSSSPPGYYVLDQYAPVAFVLCLTDHHEKKTTIAILDLICAQPIIVPDESGVSKQISLGIGTVLMDAMLQYYIGTLQRTVELYALLNDLVPYYGKLGFVMVKHKEHCNAKIFKDDPNYIANFDTAIGEYDKVVAKRPSRRLGDDEDGNTLMTKIFNAQFRGKIWDTYKRTKQEAKGARYSNFGYHMIFCPDFADRLQKCKQRADIYRLTPPPANWAHYQLRYDEDIKQKVMEEYRKQKEQADYSE